MNENILLRCMPMEIAGDLMGAGAPFAIEPGDQIDRELLWGSHVFIVTEGIASKFVVNAGGRASEVGMVGNEGLFPICGLMQVPGTKHMVIDQVGNLQGRVIRNKDFHAIVQPSDEARNLLHLYIYSFMTQIATNLMTIEQNPVMARLARWLLMCHDRSPSDEIQVTHETLAEMSFAHRPTVTRTLAEMRDLGHIETGRSLVRIMSRKGLIDLADGSYGTACRYYNDYICPFGKGFD